MDPQLVAMLTYIKNLVYRGPKGSALFKYLVPQHSDPCQFDLKQNSDYCNHNLCLTEDNGFGSRHTGIHPSPAEIRFAQLGSYSFFHSEHHGTSPLSIQLGYASAQRPQAAEAF